ncbi:hypothetical protein SAMN05443429_105119 [Cruoricaptor ignavus]|uniref:SAM-dependent chlorinase/fluorinase n=1 Tax=Cruoricaptor ignavus TaxID=1118202 RepID=A0A1M6EIN6_9FLAO|nr:SAM-dependent chlorinase/fluorinase [Cruoricaptor ignavus]QOR74263.1 SAM-dependent chlorinase/fluorinase [Cruoricaptor ignavus]SHI85354.1 hypothetical protein SAMN05443429_105119 [Cruoricaptor ignavus]
MPVITLTSDFGLTDYRTAAVKGAILSQSPQAVIADISHEIEAYNLRQASYIIHNAYRYFPKGTVHLIAVDSFYRKEVRSIVYSADGHYFVAADNGLLSLIFFDINPESVHEITLKRFDEELKSVATDILAPAAVHLSHGGVPEVIGRQIDDPKILSFQRAVYTGAEKMIVGEVMYIDNFGNLVSNISKKFFINKLAGHARYIVKFRNLALTSIYNHHTEFVKDWANESDYHGKSVAVFNEENLLELVIYRGNKNNGAKTLFGMNVGEKVYIEFFDE